MKNDGLTRGEKIGVSIAVAVVFLALMSGFFVSQFDRTQAVKENEIAKVEKEKNELQAKKLQETAILKEQARMSIEIQEVKAGEGDEALAGDTVAVNYTGSFTNGKIFDSSYQRNEPLIFKLGTGMVIKGWDLGVAGMKVGGKRHLIIPPELAYGAAGAGGVIPPNSTLVFDVELVSVSK